ncbi:hypothetical protein FBU30_002013 [Linnemannia zychae]|nr:hypothetical protein FBU30_002013 [Linnemannia zychae]
MRILFFTSVVLAQHAQQFAWARLVASDSVNLLTINTDPSLTRIEEQTIDSQKEHQTPLERTPCHLISKQAIPYIPPPTTFPPDQWGNRVPNFSQVGYRSGHIPLPSTIPVAIILQPSVDPRINDRLRIQNAIDWVGQQPLRDILLPDNTTTIQARGAVLLQTGIYRIQGSLILNQSGVVLRGEGNSPNGTVLIAMGQFKHDFINLNGLLDPSFQSDPEYLSTYIGSSDLYPTNPYVILDEQVAEVEDEYIPVGTTRLPVKDITNFSVGSYVIVERNSWKSWIERLGTDHIPKRPDDPEKTMDWDPRQYTLRYVRKIKSIEIGGPHIESLPKVQAKQTHARKEVDRSLKNRAKSKNKDKAKKPLIEKPKIKDPIIQQKGPEQKAQQQSFQNNQEQDILSETLSQSFQQHNEQNVQGNQAQGVMRFTADTGRTGHPQPYEALDDFADIRNILQEELQSSVEDDTDSEYEVPGHLHLDIPLVMNMDPIYGDGIVYNFRRETRIPTDVGLENLALWSEHDPDDAEDEDHGWFAAVINHCENCWIADVRTFNFASGFKAASGSKHITIQDCEVLEPVSLRDEGGRRYMFMLQGQMGLVKRCYTADGRHDFITGAKTAGPNVFVDSEGVRANNDAGPHDRWTTGTLYDNIHSAQLNIRNRGWMGTGQGWTGAFHVVYHASSNSPSQFQSPPGATNWIVDYQGRLGNHTVEFEGDDATFLDPELKDRGHTPRSLYWAQLVKRMGGNQQAAEAIEKLVGVAGKNKYADPLPRAFLTLDEIIEADNFVLSKMRWEMDDDDDGSVLDEMESIAQLKRDIQRMELEINNQDG